MCPEQLPRHHTHNISVTHLVKKRGSASDTMCGLSTYSMPQDDDVMHQWRYEDEIPNKEEHLCRQCARQSPYARNLCNPLWPTSEATVVHCAHFSETGKPTLCGIFLQLDTHCISYPNKGDLHLVNCPACVQRLREQGQQLPSKRKFQKSMTEIKRILEEQ